MSFGGKISRRIWGFSFIGGLLLGGCLAPTLPLPPPARPDVSVPDGDGFVRVQGKVSPLAVAFVQNRRNGKIAGQETETSGDYSLKLEAASGDRLEVWYMDGNDRSPPTLVIVPYPSEGEGGAGGAAP